MMTETERAYLAGLIDGEGCISIFVNRWNNAKRVTPVDDLAGSTLARVHICMCDEPLIRWIRRRVGSGTMYLRRVRTKAHWKPLSTIVWTGATAVLMLRQVLPYLRLKKRQAKIFIAWVTLAKRTVHWQGRRGGSAYPLWVIRKRNAWLAEMRALNRRGTLPATAVTA